MLQSSIPTPQINATQKSESMGISLRQVQRYLKQLSELNLIVREGGPVRRHAPSMLSF